MGDLCTGCGKCCIQYANGLGSIGRKEYLRLPQKAKDYCYHLFGSGRTAVYDIWVHPEDKSFKRCPFLRKRPNQEKYTCTIHGQRPNVCRDYPVDFEQAIRDGCEIVNRMPISELIVVDDPTLLCNEE
jgi:Fe-S-cluster containining protein